jgi:hypothetical protein
MKLALLILVLCIVACGRRDDNSCRSREHMRLECQAQNIPTYGYPHATEICSRSYEANRCY